MFSKYQGEKNKYLFTSRMIELPESIKILQPEKLNDTSSFDQDCI